jgi:hypothetical protein
VVNRGDKRMPVALQSPLPRRMAGLPANNEKPLDHLRPVKRPRRAKYRPARPGWTAQAPTAGRAYDRRVELPRVLPLWPHEIEDETPDGRQRIVAKLRRALRAERRRGIAGHWT